MSSCVFLISLGVLHLHVYWNTAQYLNWIYRCCGIACIVVWVLHVSCSRNPAKWIIYHTVEWVYSSPHLLKPPMWRISVRNIQCLVTLKMKQCLLIFTEPNPPPPNPIFLLCWLGSEKGIFVLVSLLEAKVSWDVESEEMLPCFPSLAFQPFPAVALGWRAAHFIFCEKWQQHDYTACRGLCKHAILRMMHEQVLK